MRLGTFVLGGLAGAAVMMMLRNNQTMSAVKNGMGQMLRQRASDMKENVLEKGMNVKFGGGMFGTSSDRSASSSSRRASSGNGGLDRVEHLASKDPNVKHEVNEILHENGQQHI